MKRSRSENSIVLIAVASVLWLSCWPLAAAGQAPISPAPGAAADVPKEAKPDQPVAETVTKLVGTVVSVKGNVQSQAHAKAKWKQVKVGDKLAMGAKVRTGLFSAVRFIIPPRQMIELDRLGVIKVITAIQKADGTLKTDLGMPYGRTRYHIEAGGQEHDTTISSTSGVLAVRGSYLVYTDDAFGARAFGEGHLSFFSNMRRQTIEFGRRAVADVSDQHDSAAANANSQTTAADARSSLRDDLDLSALLQNLATGGVDQSQLQFIERLACHGQSIAARGRRCQSRWKTKTRRCNRLTRH